MVISGYGRWLTWVNEQSSLILSTSPAGRVTSENVSLYVTDLRSTVGEFTIAARVEQLGNAMRVMVPGQHWHWVQRVADRLRVGAKASRQCARLWPPAALQGDVEPVATPNTTTSNRCLRFAEWPALDRAAWNAGLQPGDVFDPGGIAAGWAAATRGLVANGYGRWLTWLIMTDAMDPMMPPSARVTPERLRAYASD